MDEDDYERVLSVKNEVFVYKIPPRQSSRGYRAADWKLDQPDWSGRLRIIEVNKRCLLKLEDKISGKLFAEAPVDQYPGPSVESVSDSSRYFVIKIVDNGPGKQHAFIGLGFADRGDSFDFNVTLQDHFKREKQEKITNDSPNAQHLDLGFKEGETIKINFGNKGGQEAKAKPKKNSGNLGGILPPPPSGNAPRSIPAPTNSTVAVPQPVQQNKQSDADWGDFASFSNSSSTQQTSWVQF